MSQVATAVVVDGKLDPIAKAEPLVGQSFTAQAAINLFSDFTTAVNFAAGKQCQIFQAFAYQSRNATAEEIKLALSGVVESTRLTVDNKRMDTEATPMARKFQSMARAVWGAVRFGGLPLDGVSAYTNSQALYDDARKSLSDRGIDWKGLTDSEKAADAAKREIRSAMKEAAEEEGDILTLTPEQFTALKGKAAAKLAEKKAKEKLESMEKRAEKIAKDLVASYGLDDAEHVLKLAMEKLVQGVFAAV